MALKTATTIDNFGTALRAALAAEPTLKNVTITEGPPPPAVIDARDWIAILDVTFTQEWSSIMVGSFPRAEHYSQNVVIRCVDATRENQDLPSARAWARFRTISDLLRNNPDLSGFWAYDGQIITASVSDGEFTKRASDTERESSISFNIGVEARI